MTAPFQWIGLDWNVSFKLSFSTSVSTTLGWTEGCNFFNPIKYAPNAQLYALFYDMNDDTGATSTVVHVWFMGWCESKTGEGAYLCPGS